MLHVDLGRLTRRAWAARAGLIKLHLAAGTLAVGIVLLLPRWYVSSVTLVPAPYDGLALDLTGVGTVTGASSLSLSGGPTPQDRLKMVLQSRSVADSIVKGQDLVDRWKLKRHEQARTKLGNHTTITTPREGQVIVAVEAPTAAFARDLADSYGRYAASEAVRLKTTLASQRRIYLESRLAELDGEIATASDRVRLFEEKHRAVSLADQARGTMDAAGTIQAQAALLETELAAVRRYFTDNAPETRMLRDRLVELRRQLARLAGGGNGMLIGGDSLPSLRQEYLRLTREQVSLTSVNELVRRVYEQARVEEANRVPSFSMLDAADLPERPSRPQRGLVVLLTLALTFVTSMTYLHWRGARSETSDDPSTAGAPSSVAARSRVGAEREAA